MKKKILSFICLLMLLPCFTGSAQKLTEVFYQPSASGLHEKRMLVYLPEGYRSCNDRYPVLYMLHGARGNELSWIMKGNTLHHIDSLTSTGAMKKTIVVFPNMNQYDDDKDYGSSRIKGAWESFFEVDGSVEKAFVKDVVNLTDSLFRTIPDKSHRAIAGLSIGGMQSIYISASNPDTFGYVGSFSPMVKSFIRKSPHSDFYKGIRRKLNEQFKNPPLLYWIMVGRMDFFESHMDSYHHYLNEKGYPHQYYVSRGGHQWYNWKKYSIMFMENLWK